MEQFVRDHHRNIPRSSVPVGDLKRFGFQKARVHTPNCSEGNIFSFWPSPSSKEAIHQCKIAFRDSFPAFLVFCKRSFHRAVFSLIRFVHKTAQRFFVLYRVARAKCRFQKRILVEYRPCEVSAVVVPCLRRKCMQRFNVALRAFPKRDAGVRHNEKGEDRTMPLSSPS